MRAEASTPATSRYLHLVSRLGAGQFGNEINSAVAWCEANAHKLLPAHQEALVRLRNIKLSASIAAVVIHRCYADIPPDKVFDCVFPADNPDAVTKTGARLLFGIFWRRLPILALEHGHHQLAVLEFGAENQNIFDRLPCWPEDALQGGLCLSSLADWQLIRQFGRDAPMP